MRGPAVIKPALARVLVLAIGADRPHELWHRFGQHAPVLLAGLELLFGAFLRINVGAAANPPYNRALLILVRHGSRQEPAIGSGCALTHAELCFIWEASLESTLP